MAWWRPRQGVSPTLPGRPPVTGAKALGQRLDRGLERRTTLAVEHAREVEHALDSLMLRKRFS